jgi:hypothetical protein
MQREPDVKVQIAGLWANVNQNGEITSMSGSLGGARLLVIPNKFKREQKHPDYKVFIVQNPPKDRAPQQTVQDESDLPF